MMISILIGVFASALAAGLIYTHVSTYRLSHFTWDELLLQIKPVVRDGVAMVALDHLDPKPNQITMEPNEMWNSLGGVEGLKIMRDNVKVLLALAAYVEQENHGESAFVAEGMRRDGVQLRRAIFRMRLELLLHKRSFKVPFYLHEAASAYYLMTQRLLALYQTSHEGLYPRLSECVYA